jgi:hypothetical protein
MTAIFSLIGAIGIIGSLLFSGWQARVLARQVGFQATMDGVATLHEMMVNLHNVQQLIADDPTLIPHFFPERGACPLDTADQGKVRVVAGMYADVLAVGLYALSAVPAASNENSWKLYCQHLLDTSTAIRAEVAAKPWGYPRLTELVDFSEPKQTKGDDSSQAPPPKEP